MRLCHTGLEKVPVLGLFLSICTDALLRRFHMFEDTFICFGMRAALQTACRRVYAHAFSRVPARPHMRARADLSLIFYLRGEQGSAKP